LSHPGPRLPILDLEVMLEEIDDREVGRVRPIGHGAGCQRSPRPQTRRTSELVDQPRLADAWLSHHAHDLAVASLDLYESITEDLELLVAAHEATQRPPAEPVSGSLAARPPISPRRRPRRSISTHELEPP